MAQESKNWIDIRRQTGTILPRIPDTISADSQMSSDCKHPKVRVVAREEDVEYVECQDCGEVFDSNEFEDMTIEEKGELEAEE